MAKRSVLELSVPLDDIELSGALYMTDQSNNRIIFTDFQYGGSFMLEGHGFDVKSGKITAGTVEDLIIFDPQGKQVLEFQGIDLSVKPIPQNTPLVLVSALLELGLLQSNIMTGSSKDDDMNGQNGADVMKGAGGADELDGGLGKDVLWGNGGFDTFDFGTGYGKDKIMDFDADPDGGGQDLISAVFLNIVSKSGDHGNTVLDFGNGDVLTLVGVKAQDIDATDFAV